MSVKTLKSIRFSKSEYNPTEWYSEIYKWP